MTVGVKGKESTIVDPKIAASTPVSSRIGAVLVVGGGVGGVQAALDLAESGFKVYIVDSTSSIGGVMAQLDKTFPTNDCSMCILSPKLVECGRHLNIEILTCSEIEGITGKAGDFKVTVKQRPKYIDVEKCTGCSECAKYCPVDAIDVFNEGLSERAAVYVKYPQAVPLAYMIDRDVCIGCGLCESMCLADAIHYDDQEGERELNVGAIILAPGLEEFDASIKSEYGYGKFRNVITSIEFERILSASGPFRGRVQRPSDGEIPRRIAFIQCVGSRDTTCGNSYCSSVCCMYATKEAVIAKEHQKDVEPTIFYIDMRSYGKDFDKYIERAKEEYGVRFIRCRVSSVSEDPETKNLRIRYENEEGKIVEEEFDLVVLSVGFESSEGIRELAYRLDIELDEYGFCKTPIFHPLETSKPGIFVCGAFSSPKDIPETVMQASGAAACAEGLLSPSRGTLIKSKEYPGERTIRGQPPRIGVFVCHCGINIGGVVDVPNVVEYARTLPHVVYSEANLYTCSSDTQKLIKEKIEEYDLNRVIVASCTPRTHEPLFQETIRESGLNRYLFEMANIRDQCSWVHMHEPEAATEKARDLVRMAVAKASKLEPLERLSLSVIPRGLVVGGGLAGMTSALALAEQGFQVYLVEKEKELGGFLRHIHYLLDGSETKKHLEDLIEKVQSNKMIEIFLEAKIEEISGYVGNFKTAIAIGEDREKREVEHGVVLVATGGEEYHPDQHLYGKDPRVLTQLELEERLSSKKFSGEPQNVVMIQCIGSRDDTHPYCSRMCCSEAVKNALKLKEVNPKSEVFILYRDIRTYGIAEKYYLKAREEGVTFIRYNDTNEPRVVEQTSDEGGKVLAITVFDPTLGEEILIEADFVVLSAGVVPPKANESLAKMLKVPLNEDGFFLEAHVKLRPVDFSTEGVFVCGMAHAPKSIEESISQARAAASRASTILARDAIEAEGVTADVNDRRCNGCGLCVLVCAYNAIEIDEEKKVAVVNTALCKGCGACTATCRPAAIDLRGFTNEQLVSVINSF
ncbi:MAG: CoB--CoM heterodisulfide reductase iron-sulfur subunit A family protein [Candidatus Bathyarchaeota archaeon]|nr:MAG: CoB--CoM heterodisulfide reductase iron-sulfur subunit A family protein [Candidatus Bathyarchaeota archaeon]